MATGGHRGSSATMGALLWLLAAFVHSGSAVMPEVPEAVAALRRSPGLHPYRNTLDAEQKPWLYPPTEMGQNSHIHPERYFQAPARTKDGGHYLTNSQLRGINTIHCLQAKQKHPKVDCGKEETNPAPILGIGTYPSSWRDPKCRSYDEFYCDPTGLLDPPGAAPYPTNMSERLRSFRTSTLVSCQALEQRRKDPETGDRPAVSKIEGGSLLPPPRDHRPFNLAVALADQWPRTELDPDSLQKFGQVLMGQWGLQSIYNGVDAENSVDPVWKWSEYYENCPNAAVLIILPRYEQVFLSSPSCEFICESRGGPEVVAVTQRALREAGLSAAIFAGIEAVERVLSEAKPLSLQKSAPVRPSWRTDVSEYYLRQDQAWVFLLRFLMVMLICAFILTVFFAVYFNFVAPYREKREYQERERLFDEEQRHWVEEQRRWAER